jgi:hypothetical protein
MENAIPSLCEINRIAGPRLMLAARGTLAQNAFVQLTAASHTPAINNFGFPQTVEISALS